MTAPDPAASVVICTFNRLGLLKAAVTSCLESATQRGTPFEIIISDNSPSGHARAYAEDLVAAGKPVRWVAASPPNISIARNTGLRTARAELVAFLDDDLEVEPGWLDHLIDTLERSGADAAVGPVRPRFVEGTAPDWDPEGRFFTRVLPLPSGTPIAAGGQGRIKGFAISTASSIWRSSTCFTDPEPFDPAFGASGGEDLDAFLRLERRGRRFVWCAEAGVWEAIPAGRTDLGYQLMRAYSGGQVFTAATLHNQAPPVSRKAGMLAIGAAQLGVGSLAVLASALLRPLSGAAGRQRLVRHLLRTAGAAGKLTWWRKLPLYHVEKPPAA
ncbi:glycosyltransferase family 2 protein [Roseomonas sp. SSH11]|uniref:Glycosyltransferase family 2 protein n=1 Tax=Pararoseomonas baculiformis TaxID=2820812 RepID=A0ABS4ALY8_9PROT|nr:glycosyltransferase family 2 protein [Pararoseomonas baculiformis]MBP0447234.1 glycosyltransferase family 2 protein [Pararoseomonas baculiformis]